MCDWSLRALTCVPVPRQAQSGSDSDPGLLGSLGLPASPRLRTLPGPPPFPAASQARAMAGAPAASASAAAALAGQPAGRCTTRLSGWQAGCYPRPVQISDGRKSPALPKLRQARCQPEWPVTCVSASCLGGPVLAAIILEHAAGSASSSFAGISNREVPATDSLPTAPN